MLTKILTQTDWGYYSLFQNLVLMTSIIAGLSLPSAIVYFSASAQIDKFKLLYNFIIFQLVLSVLIVLGFFFVNNYISKDLIKLNIPNFYWIFFLQLSFTMLNNIIVGLMRGEFMFNKINLLVFLANFVTFGFYVSFYFFDLPSLNLEIIFYFLIIVSLLQVFSSLFLFYKNQKEIDSKFVFLRKKEVKTIYKFIIYVYLANVLQIFVYKIDTWILFKYFDSNVTGVYALAVTVSQTTWLFATAVSTILFSIAAKESIDFSRGILKTYIRLSFLVSMFLGAALLFFLYFFSDLIFGKEYKEIIYIIPILLLGIVPFSINVVFAAFAAGLNKNYINMIGSAISFVMMLVFDFILIPHYSYWGASAATVIAYMSSTFFCLIMMKVVFDVDVKSIFGIKYFYSDMQKAQTFIMSKMKK